MRWLPVLLLLWACGGQEAEPAGPEVPAPGRVVVENRTPFAVEVAFLDGGGRVVRSQVAAGAAGEVSAGLLPGGSEWTFDLVLLLPPEQGYRVRRKARILVAGEVRLVAALADPGDVFSLAFGGAGP